ncbi:MAG: hypothetical protein ABIF71_12510 [Planctomycetota bacterium]
MARWPALVIAGGLLVTVACGGPTARPAPQSAVCFDLRAYFTNDGISWNKDRFDGNFDTVQNPHGSTYPAEEFPAANTVQPVLGLPGLLMAIPPTADDALNNLACDGQILNAFVPQRFDRLYFVGSATMGAQSGRIGLRYRDGTTAEVALEMPDWCRPPADLGTREVCAFSHRHDYRGADEPVRCALFAVPVPLDGTRFLEAIQLPRNANIHLFALTALVAR